MRCATNTDPHTSDPLFQLRLEESSSGEWYVVIGGAGSSSSATSDSGTVPPKAN